MFVLCPHCHFLVGIDPRTGAPPPLCPKCGRPLDADAEASHADASQASAAPSPASADNGPAPVATPAASDVSVEIATTPGADESAVASAAAPATPTAPTTPAPQLDAEALIAAMAAKPPRRTGARRKDSANTGERAEASRASPAPRPSRSKRKPAPVATSAQAEATPPPASATPRRASWWSRLRETWRARAATAAADKASRTSPPADPLAASVRNRARRRAEAAVDAAAAATTPQHDGTAPDAPTPKPAHAPVPEPTTRSGTAPAAEGTAASVELDVARVPTGNGGMDAEAVDAESGANIAGQTDAKPAPPKPAPQPPEPATDATSAPLGPPVPFVERRRNPDLPIPPGTLPTHPLRRRTDAPSFARLQPVTLRAERRDWRTPAAVAALSLLLGLQLLLAQRDTLAADARWRPLVSALCAGLRCTLPPWREPAAFTMLGRDVRAHPSAPGALLIQASFRNDARWPQPWPRVLLTLSNVDGRIVGARAFDAREYLGTDAQATRELAPGQTAAISLAVVEPAPDIVAFSFDFR